jgi:predicted phosphate transport protein (TIGR00153 family)
MLGRLMPREGKFFDLFNAHAERIVEGSRELRQMIGEFSDLEAHAQRIDSAERAADRITHETITLLHKTFITPFDRDQIHQLITSMDDILDLIQDVAESIALYDLRSITPEAKQLAEICQLCCDRVKVTVGLLTDIKRSDAILKCCQEIDRLESDADRVMRAALSKLFREETDLKQVMKLRVIYELLESITDRCEDVVNVIEGITLKMA